MTTKIPHVATKIPCSQRKNKYIASIKKKKIIKKPRLQGWGMKEADLLGVISTARAFYESESRTAE